MSWNSGDQIVLRWTGHRAWLDEKAERDQGRIRYLQRSARNEVASEEASPALAFSRRHV